MATLDRQDQRTHRKIARMNVMLDVECYGLGPNAFVWEIGVVTWSAADLSFVPRHTFSVFIDTRLTKQPIDTAAIEWAEDNCRSHEALRERMSTESVEDMLADTVHGLTQLTDLCRDSEAIWARGASFDFPKISRTLELIDDATGERGDRTAFASVWDRQYRKLRCMRDLLAYGFGGARGCPADSGSTHSGMDDACAQAEYVYYAKSHIYKALRLATAHGVSPREASLMRYSK